MADLDALANIAEILGAVFVVGGVAFAIVQIRQFRRQRLEIAALELTKTFQNADFTRAYTELFGIPDGIRAAELRAQGPDLEAHAILVSIAFESIGVMVHRRIVPLEVVDDLMGGTIVGYWHKLSNWVEEVRAESHRDDTHEWFQWLAERIEQRTPRVAYVPAYRRHRDWRA